MRRPEDLTGRRFGMLTVIEKREERQDRYCMWLCRCDCGGEILVSSKRLKRGTVTDCGCIPKKDARNGTIREDLTGRTYGRLTAVLPVKSAGGRSLWLCRCTCGRLHTAAAYDLKTGKVKSCGCSHSAVGQGVRDLTGQTFGRLTVLYPIQERDKKGSVLWRCYCTCGKEVDLSEDRLVHGQYRSCGCLKEEMQKQMPGRLHMIDHTCVEILEKRKRRKDNTSGFRGVSLLKNGRYRVSIGFKKQRFHIGIFSGFEEAVQARLEAEKLIHDGFLQAYYRWEKLPEDTPFLFEAEKVGGEIRITTNIKEDT